jgi:hypothetical protein
MTRFRRDRREAIFLFAVNAAGDFYSLKSVLAFGARSKITL